MGSVPVQQKRRTGLATNQRTILIVEDEPIIRMSAVATLQDAGFSVLEARNSAEAIRTLAHHPEISILITDVRMPGHMDGLALVAQVRLDHPDIRSIIVSDNLHAQQAANAGAVGFVQKPHLPQTMVQVVRDTTLLR
jgi:DNA-binding NtrC family response regulator